MSGTLRFMLGIACGVGLALLPRVAAHLHAMARHLHGAPVETGPSRVHTEEKFSFIAHASMERVAPLFGADKERVWAPHWDPSFIHPSPAQDAGGMVFTVAHGELRSAWVNTAFDLRNGHVQYVYTIPDHLVTVITLNLLPQGNVTKVEVEYDRTSLRAEADEHVLKMASEDRTAGPEWERQINDYLDQHASSGQPATQNGPVH